MIFHHLPQLFGKFLEGTSRPGGFDLKNIMVSTPRHHPFIDRIFYEINHLFQGVPTVDSAIPSQLKPSMVGSFHGKSPSKNLDDDWGYPPMTSGNLQESPGSSRMITGGTLSRLGKAPAEMVTCLRLTDSLGCGYLAWAHGEQRQGCYSVLGSSLNI